MAEPIRHQDSPRNRRKALHQAEVICEELEFLLVENAKRRVNLQYAYSKARKLKNRLRAFT
jgi:hypothetical protein